ncbi:hypothetical protein VEHSUH05_01610 [Veillonella denticariosi JCM 15641]|uniref:Uncharacterized protein n=1 Tax=Veillonella denticariosi JCM 15641 TaxID=1298594 RepID=A0A2S7ZCY5_9FIRM|nr:hypothetical protein [Veillonella denticariosi]PQL21146.1 hypothetical protein VEHSUH05_01610 [Veillonella denticariosi JCM 15641]
MDSILSTVLSIFEHNPVFALMIIGYVLFSFLKNSKSKDSQDSDEEAYTSYSNSEEMTWEDMEKEYGISIERKEASSEPDVERTVERAAEEQATSFKTTTQEPETVESQKTVAKPVQDKPTGSSNPIGTATGTAGGSVEGPTLQERLAAFKRDKAGKIGKVLADNIGVTASSITKPKVNKKHLSVREGMKWSFILGKPKALERRYR